MAKIRKNLRIYRNTKLMTQEQFAAGMGVNRQLYGNVEVGKRQGSTAFWEALRIAYNVPVEDMYALQMIEEVGEDVEKD